MENSSDGYLPADIIEEILLRLPVKTLLKFKCVCKHWYALVGSPSFVGQHYVHASNRERLLIKRRGSCSERYALYVDETFSRYEVPDHLQIPDKVTSLLGPLNGIFCVHLNRRCTALLNPAMRQFKPLPLLPYASVPLWPRCNTIGFGLDPLSGEYKVVLIELFKNAWPIMNYISHPPPVSIYCSGTDSWRPIEGDVDLINSVFHAYRPLFHTCLNGACYWFMETEDKTFSVLAFNISSEKFRKIQVPDCIVYGKTAVRLALYGDSLTLLSYNYADVINKRLDIWMMEKEGCWSRFSTIGPFQDMLQPLCFMRNNELLFENISSCLALYDIPTQKLRTLEVRVEEYCFHWVFYYKESLFSLKGGAGKCMLWDLSSDFIKDFFKNNLSSSSY